VGGWIICIKIRESEKRWNNGRERGRMRVRWWRRRR